MVECIVSLDGCYFILCCENSFSSKNSLGVSEITQVLKTIVQPMRVGVSVPASILQDGIKQRQPGRGGGGTCL